MNVLIIDNNDSFTYNLAQLVEENCGAIPTILKYDEVNSQLLRKFDKIIISPGPGIPEDFPNLMKWIKMFAPQKSILGICMGHEAIAKAYGGEIEPIGKIYHGQIKTSKITDSGEKIFKDVPLEFKSGLYHSWKISEKKFPKQLIITSIAEDGVIMSIRHNKYDLTGVQFHPESIMTPYGSLMISNWLLSDNS